jgi:putative OPT family oligopeptide transporter
MTVANVYLGLYAGMTVSASIPAAVISMSFYSALKKKALLESNIVQTMASAGESLAAGIIFTLPALVIIGAWKDFEFWPTTLIAICGGLLGILFMIPLRKALIEDDKELIYPEGVACATVLKAGASEESTGGLSIILKGLGIGALFKFFSSGLKLFTGSVEYAGKMGNSIFFFGGDASPALLAVGYIVNLNVAALVFIGGSLGWFIAIPILGTPSGMEDLSNLDLAWTLWSKQVRYLGVGAMITGGLWSIFSVRRGVAAGFSALMTKYTEGDKVSKDMSQRDLGLVPMGILFVVCFVIMLFLYNHLIGSFGYSLLTTIIMIFASFIFVAVSSYIVGLVGSSNNPVSGMTISALLATAILFLIFGFKGDSAILATLGVAAVVCCAACTAGDCSQDLKTGSILKATPRSQQIAQVIGVIIPAFFIPITLSFLHKAYGIGTGLKAPQATLFASITKALFGNGELPYNMVIYGAIIGAGILIFDNLILKPKGGFRLHLMPLAVGIYLPITLAVPMLIGGIIRFVVEKKKSASQSDSDQDNGVLLSSGLIAGEALMGVFVAILLVSKIDVSMVINHGLVEGLSIAAFILVSVYLYLKSKATT